MLNKKFVAILLYGSFSALSFAGKEELNQLRDAVTKKDPRKLLQLLERDKYLKEINQNLNLIEDIVLFKELETVILYLFPKVVLAGNTKAVELLIPTSSRPGDSRLRSE